MTGSPFSLANDLGVALKESTTPSLNFGDDLRLQGFLNMPTYRGNRGNLLQHWVLAEILSLLRQHLPAATKLCFVDAHSMSPYAVRSDKPSQTSDEFDEVADHLPGAHSPYEQSWHALRHGRSEYPSSASIVRHLWSGPLHLVLCEQDPQTAREIEEWQRAIPDTRLNLHKGDWRERYQLDLPKTADAYLLSFDPYMFDRHARPDAHSRGNLWPSDLVGIAAAISRLGHRPVVVQISSYSANNDNAQQDVVRGIEPVFESVGLTLAAIVRADGNMMSLVFTKDMPGFREAQLENRFRIWLDQATGHTEHAASDVGAPRRAKAPRSVGRELVASEYLSGTTATTQVGYVNRNRQQCLGHRRVAGTDHGQVAYQMQCLACGHVYGANGTDIFQRKCPACGGGAPGIPF